jgi:eukaryotic-like serine/threonine-protein kinase
VIADRYQPIEQIGTGGMATVWKARDTLLGRFVAVKRLLPHLAGDPEAAERFKREAHAAAQLSHPGIVTVFDTGEDADGPFIVQELVDGTTLAAHLAHTGPLGPQPVTDIVSQVAAALDHAHSVGVIHRDIKPANLIMEPDGRVRIADFGIAHTVDDPATITASGELVGTITYLAPEILAGQPATPASDIYSLGAVTYELLSGQPPYQAPTPAALLEAVRIGDFPDLRGVVPDQMALAVAGAMARDPVSRPQSAGAFAATLMGSATMVMATTVIAATPASPLVPRGSEEPTVVTERKHAATPAPVPSGRRRASRLPLLLLVLAVAVVAAAAMTDDPGDGGGTLPAPTTTVAQVTTTLPPPPTTTTTTIPTTTTVPTTTTIVVTPEVVAGEIGALLAGMSPPDFRRRDVRQVEDRLERVMEEWEGDNRDELRRELERAFEEVADLEESTEREELTARLIQLSELMGFRVDQIGQGDGEDDDDG